MRPRRVVFVKLAHALQDLGEDGEHLALAHPCTRIHVLQCTVEQRATRVQRHQEQELLRAVCSGHDGVVDERHEVGVLEARVHLDLPVGELTLLRQLGEHFLQGVFLGALLHQVDKAEASLRQHLDDA